MNPLRPFALFALSTLTLVSLAACSSSSPANSGSTSSDGGLATNASTPGTIGSLCSSTTPCGTGLLCAESGSLLGRCTADCTSDTNLCALEFGADTVCMNAAQCALLCTGPSACAGEGVCTPLSSGQSACITNPNGPPGAAPPPNGGCYNLGGAFGDTVANGGYRCSFTNTQDEPTGVDLCTNGVWSSAYTCNCQVTGDNALCTDFTTAGTVQCEYGFQSCAQCAPGTGCGAD